MPSQVLLTPSKASFLRNLIPANENDAFNDNRCAYCWDAYHEDHQPVRVLPCNHVFGRACLLEVIESSPTAELCMVCRTQLFQPPLPQRWKIAMIEGLRTVDLALLHVIDSIRLPNLSDGWPRRKYDWVMLVWSIWHPIMWAERMVVRYTHLTVRNPDLDLARLFAYIQFNWLLNHLAVIFALFKLVCFGTSVARLLDFILFRFRGFMASDSAVVCMHMKESYAKYTAKQICGSLAALTCSSSKRSFASHSQVQIYVSLFTCALFYLLLIRGRVHGRDRLLMLAILLGATCLHHLHDIWLIVAYRIGAPPWFQRVGQLIFLWKQPQMLLPLRSWGQWADRFEWLRRFN
ncbi:hypothetical protein BDV95DRAFT_608058 [Massariosphaeria phaeospora]|uniref:RING-type domain-containing protein n=1 Tax=Massariosphaeria phaeospora TaxID=100035 RepID=A0A7C8M6J1_9PLEO|nr:hypothetical protein BDV95DRAFT_608058 [Massariosphaeria phaeospora]